MLINRQILTKFWSIPLAVVLLWSTGCPSSVRPTDANTTDFVQGCPRDEWAYLDDELDGVRQEHACLETPFRRAARGENLFSTRGLSSEFGFGFGNDRNLIFTLPICGFGINFYNVPLTNRSMGGLVHRPFPPFEVQSPYVTLVGVATQFNCMDSTHIELTGGSWEIIQPGDEGQIVEVEGRDVTFAPIFGHQYTIHRVRFRVRLPDNIDVPPSPWPGTDAGPIRD